jgi:DNA invertase Pin-like site-specific DNA recombinase
VNKAAIYCRLSKEDQDKISEGDESASIHNQKMMLVDYALEHDFIIHDIYSDDDFKGFDQERPEFNRMLTDAKLKKFNIIICKTQSRFTRDMELVERYIHGMFPLLGIRFIGVVDHVDTNIKGNKKARQINGLINEWYSEDLSENIRSVFRAKMEKGEFLGAFACYGYLKDPKNNHRLIIDEPAAIVVRKIFNYSIQGLGNKQICIMLQNENIPTPCVYKTSQGFNYQHPKKDNFGYKYGLWGANSVRRILTNRMYIGEMVQGRERKVSYKSKKVVELPKEEWIIVPGCHEPIIEKEVFELVQSLIKSRRYARTIDEDGNKKSALLAGKLRCLDCGNILTRINGQQKYIYLYCSLYKRSGRTQCTPHSIHNSKLEELLKDKIRMIINNHLEHHQLDDLLINHDENEKLLSKKKLQLQKLNTKQVRTKKALAMIYIDKSNDIIPENEYLELKASLDKEREDLEGQYTKLIIEINDLSRENDHQEKKEGLVRKYTDFDTLTPEIVNEFIDFIEVGEKNNEDNQEIIIHWRF